MPDVRGAIAALRSLLQRHTHTGGDGSRGLGTGVVTSEMILDGTIVNADVNASAAIAASKLDAGGTFGGSGTATFPGAIKPSAGANFFQSVENVSLPNLSTLTLTNSRGIAIVTNVTDNTGQMVAYQASSSTFVSVASFGLICTLNSDSGATLALFWDGSNLVVKNRYGSTKAVRVILLAN